MNVYLESNFVIELALLQEQHASCDALLSLGEAGTVVLMIPAFSLAEPYEALGRRHGERKRIKRELEEHLRLLARTQSYSEQLSGFEAITNLVVDSADVEIKRLEEVRSRLLHIAEVLPLDRETLESALDCQDKYDLSPQDAIVFATVLGHLPSAAPAASCFLNKDKDFDTPGLVGLLDRHRCKLLPRFDTGHEYVRHAVA